MRVILTPMNISNAPLLAGALFFASINFTSPATAVVIEFGDQSTLSATSFSYSEDGFDFTINQLGPLPVANIGLGNDGEGDFTNGTPSFLESRNNGAYFEVILAAGPGGITEFDLISLDLFNGTFGNRDAAFVGFKSSGDVTLNLTLSGREQQFVTFGPEFQGITGFRLVPQGDFNTIGNHRYSIDNVTIDFIPEPGPLSLALAALTIVLLFPRSLRRRAL